MKDRMHIMRKPPSKSTPICRCDAIVIISKAGMRNASRSGCQKSDFDNLRIKTAEADFYSKASHLLQKWLFSPKNGAEKPIFAVVN